MLYEKVFLANNIEDLQEYDLAFIVEDYPEEDVFGIFHPTAEIEEFRPIHNSKTKPIDIGTIVHGRLFIANAVPCYLIDENFGWASCEIMETLY